MLSYLLPSFNNPLRSVVEQATNKTVAIGKALLYAVGRGCAICTVAGIAFAFALLIYLCLLALLMPIAHQTADVQLYTEGNCKIGQLDVGDSIVFQREIYHLKLVLDLPESDVNFAVGNFDVTVIFSGNVTNRGTGIMKFRSLLVRWARAALFLPLHVFGIWEESQQVSVQLKTPLLEAVSSASVQICPKELQVYSAWLHVEPDLTGLRGFIAHHPYLAGLMNVLLICVLEGLAIHRVFKKFRVKRPVESGNKQAVEISSKERNQKHVIRLVESLQPLPESQCVSAVPKDFSHLLLPEPSKQTWLSTLGCNTKKKVS